jgi:hypothetical protein
MTKARCALGCAIMLAASAGFLVSNYLVDAAIPGIDRTAESATPTRLCTDIDGKSFRWSWPNAPFGSSCRDDGKRQ